MGLGNIGNYIDENWHGGTIHGDFYDHPEMTIEETLKVDKKPRTLTWNWKHAMTRELMRGRHKAEILAKYATAIDRFGIRDRIVSFLDKNDGFLGWFIVDVSNFDEKFGYCDMPEDMRRCNLYAYNATELREIISRSLISENDGTMDGFLNSDEGIKEEVTYVDEYTGLPCVDDIQSIFDNEDNRLPAIADFFLGRKWMSMSERNNFVKSSNKLAYLVAVLKRSFAPKSNSNGNFEDVVNTYDVKPQELEAVPQKAVKDVTLVNIKENRMDDLGNAVVMPAKFDIVKENKPSDFRKDVQVGRPVSVQEVTNIKENVMGDLGNDVSMPDKFDIKKEIRPTDLKKDVSFDKVVPLQTVDRLRDFEINDIGNVSLPKKQDVGRLVEVKVDDIGDVSMNAPIEVTTRELPSDIIKDVDTGDSIDYGKFDDNMTELSQKDFKDDVTFDNVEDFVIDDIKDMKDDEFDYADLSKGEVDIDEMFEEEADPNEAEVDDAPEEVEISTKYDWSW